MSERTTVYSLLRSGLPLVLVKKFAKAEKSFSESLNKTKLLLPSRKTRGLISALGTLLLSRQGRLTEPELTELLERRKHYLQNLKRSGDDRIGRCVAWRTLSDSGCLR